jgi:hypothetical protein
MFTKLLIVNLFLSFSISWNSNTCAWGSLEKNAPQNPTDCLADQTSEISNCCFVKLTLMANKEYKICFGIPKYLVASASDEDISKSLQNDIVNVFTITELICRSQIQVIPDKKNILTHNTCGYDKVKFDPPKEVDDCVHDEDPSFSMRCCYMESTLDKDGSKIKACSSISKVRDFDFDTWKVVYKSMGSTLTRMECNPSVNEKTPIPTTILLKNDSSYLISNIKFSFLLYLYIYLFI